MDGFRLALSLLQDLQDAQSGAIVRKDFHGRVRHPHGLTPRLAVLRDRQAHKGVPHRKPTMIGAKEKLETIVRSAEARAFYCLGVRVTLARKRAAENGRISWATYLNLGRALDARRLRFVGSRSR